MMKVGLIKETKNPEDNRVALSPKQMAQLQRMFPDCSFVVQKSDVRAFSDAEYACEGIQLVDAVDDCDLLFGIKEARLETLLPDKHYVFFGHIAKMQSYNRPLLQTMMARRITFTDYEYLVDDQGRRVCAFGWWAGVVGVYLTLRGYGLREHLYELPKPDRRFTLEILKENLKKAPLPAVKLLVTGNGRVSQGAQMMLKEIGAQPMSEEQFLATPQVPALSYCVADADRLVKHKADIPFSWAHFTKHATEYESDFMRWARATDILLCGHFWAPDAPVYLSAEDLRTPGMRIRMIGDVTCDIQGSIQSTLRASTHDKPYYDYAPAERCEAPAFSSKDNITVMAVDTCPNALAMDTSAFFGEMLMQNVLPDLLTGKPNEIVRHGTILQAGELTPPFAYLADFAKGE